MMDSRGTSGFVFRSVIHVEVREEVKYPVSRVTTSYQRECGLTYLTWSRRDYWGTSWRRHLIVVWTFGFAKLVGEQATPDPLFPGGLKDLVLEE